MPEMPTIDVRPDLWEIVRNILQKHVPQHEVWAFGSRVKWTAKEYSDLDLAIITDKPLSFSTSAALREDFSESDLPWRVDFLDWATTSESFREVVARDKVVVQTAEQWPTMTSDWRKTLLGEVFEVNPPRALKRGSIAPFVPMEALPQYARSVERIAVREYTGSGMRFRNGDTLVARITPCLENGKTAFVSDLPDDQIAHGSTEYIVLSGKQDETSSLFAYYLARTPAFRQYAINHMEGTSGRQRVSASAIKQYPMILPPLAEQHAITHILGSLDDRIANLRQTNATLEAIARALFKSWFVDFDTVPIEDMQASELGLIPKGWRVDTLTDFADLNPETWTRQTRPNHILYVDLSNTKWGRIERITSYAAKDAPSRAQRVLHPNDTIIGMVRPGNGSYAFVDEEGLTGSTGFAVLRPRKDEYAALVYIAATARDNIDRLANLADGGAYPAVRPEIVASTKIVVADEAIATFYQNVHPILQSIAHNERESRTLAALRDTLLPRLISGDLRVARCV